jgi:multidrug efflux pump subunit AcrB
MVVYTLGAYHSTMKTMIEGAILAIIVVFVFLRDWRATLIAAIALPLSIIPAFWAIDAAGFSLNLVSLLAITIVTGILVDDAIVEIENIVRHMRMGKSPYRAALEAADEIGLAVIAITLTIIAVFVPVSFMGGIAGQYFKQFGLVVAFAVFSLLVARLITPLPPPTSCAPRITATRRLAAAALHAVDTLVGGASLQDAALGLAIFAGSVGASPAPAAFCLPTTAAPAARGRAPPGSRTPIPAVTDTIARNARPHRRQQRHQRRPGDGSGAEVRKATLIINIVPKESALTQDQVRDEIGRSLAGVPDIRLVPEGQRPAAAAAGGSRDGAAEPFRGRADQRPSAFRCWPT